MGCFSSTGIHTFKSLQTTNSSTPFVRQMTNIREQYTVVKCLGSGNFGSCYLVKDKRFGIERIAKELLNSLINENITSRLQTELLILRDLDHPCIAKVYEIIETATRIYIITEHLTGGVLYERYSSSSRVSERLAAKYISDIILALNCAHYFKLIHRDIKPTNLLFESNAPDSHVKLIDFGITILQKPQTFYTDSVQYMAPEVISGNPVTKSDIWSTGVILYSMLTGTEPFEEENHEKTAQKILNSHPDYTSAAWAEVSPDALSLVRKMLSKNPKDRPSAEEILSDDWIQSYNKNTIKDTPLSTLSYKKLVVLNASIMLEKSIFSFISNQVLSSKDMKKLKDMFKVLDKDGSGTLSIAELNSGYDSIGMPPPAGIIDLLKKLDTDDSGSIDYFEFLKGSEEWGKMIMKKEFNAAAKKYEKGFDAKLSLDELKGTIPDIKGTEWYDWLTAADRNGDGFITLEELKQYLSTKLGI